MDKIKHLEKLSKLEFSEAERVEFGKEFAKILDFVGEIASLNIDTSDKNYNTIKFNELREDKITSSMQRKDTLLNAPCAQDGCYVTPLVVE